MNICYVNTHDLIGGAERCSFDLFTELRKVGHQTSLIVGRKLSSDPNVHQMQTPAWDWRPRAFLHYRFGLTDTTLVTPHLMVLRHPAFQSADVINVHNMHGCYWNFWTLPVMARKAPVVLTLHDEWFLTGDCVYTYACDRWKRSCGQCPQMTWPIRPNLGGRDCTRININLKRAAVRVTPEQRLTIVTPSQWLASHVRQAPHLSGLAVRVIPNGIDLDIFRPANKKEAKAALGLPQDKICFLFFAGNLDDPRKGLPFLDSTIKASGLPSGAMLLLTGNGAEEAVARFREADVYPCKYLATKQEVARCLSAADCLLLLSTADNLPYSAIEALACGCPVIARRVGGIGEIVEDGATGMTLTPDAPDSDLYRAMDAFVRLSAEGRIQLAARCRAEAEQRFAMSQFVERYKSLYEEVREAKRDGGIGASRPMHKTNRQSFEEEIVKYALDSGNHDSFARLLNRILPVYAESRWGQDSPNRRHFMEWQRSGFNLSSSSYMSPIPEMGRLREVDFEARTEMVGVEISEATQLRFLDEVCLPFREEYCQFPVSQPPGPVRFHLDNQTFRSVDAEVAYSVVRHFSPARIIEIGSGYSTLLMASACKRNLVDGGSPCNLTSVDPAPPDLMRGPIEGLSSTIRQRVEDLPLETFATLNANDILFIDSSHVLKMGSDVQYEILEILPRLRPGVLVHIHDIFLPYEYPRNWPLNEHIFFTEQYMLQAFLCFNRAFEVLWAGSYMHRKHPDKLTHYFPGYAPSTVLPGSFWLRRCSFSPQERGPVKSDAS